MKFHYDPVTASAFTAALLTPLVFFYVPVLDSEMTDGPHKTFVLIGFGLVILPCQ